MISKEDCYAIIGLLKSECTTQTAWESGIQYACHRLEAAIATIPDVVVTRTAISRQMPAPAPLTTISMEPSLWHDIHCGLPKKAGWYWISTRDKQVLKVPFKKHQFNAPDDVVVLAWMPVEPTPEPYLTYASEVALRQAVSLQKDATLGQTVVAKTRKKIQKNIVDAFEQKKQQRLTDLEAQIIARMNATCLQEQSEATKAAKPLKAKKKPQKKTSKATRSQK